jgi:hypothetical protein
MTPMDWKRLLISIDAKPDVVTYCHCKPNVTIHHDTHDRQWSLDEVRTVPFTLCAAGCIQLYGATSCQHKRCTSPTAASLLANRWTDKDTFLATFRCRGARKPAQLFCDNFKLTYSE